MPDPLLSISNLQTRIGAGDRPARVVDGVSLSIDRGETFALLGESGCGKSMTALSIMRLTPSPAARIEGGEIRLDGRDLLALSEAEMRDVRGRRIAMIFQEPQTSLNPVLTVGQQIGETLARHQGMRGAAQREQVVSLLDDVGIPDPARRVHEYPHQLSGGMKQRVMIAMALAGRPDLLIADEPTTALDVTIQAQVLDLLRRIQRDTGMAILLITHDLGVVAEMADRVAVMYAGQIVEQAACGGFFRGPAHPYSVRLFESLPDVSKRGRPLAVIPGSVPPLTQDFPGCRFVERCDRAVEDCSGTPPAWHALDDGQQVLCHLYAGGDARDSLAGADRAEQESAPHGRSDGDAPRATLKVSGLRVHFPIHKGLLKRVAGHVYAVDGLDFEIPPGRTLALVGESGCGKTTAGKGILQLIRPTAGKVLFGDTDLTALRRSELRAHRSDLQIIFQDPYASMNPRMMIGDIVEEGMITQGIGDGPADRRRRVEELLSQVGLDPSARNRYPHEFSGGQRQRICIARALAVRPRLIVCDEPTSALDVSVQAQILNLLKRLQREYGLSYLFITHNLSVVEYLAHEVAVMYLGRIVEYGGVGDVLDDPRHPYTRALLSAVPVADPDGRREIIRLDGELPSPSAPPAGCHFSPRCPEAMPACREAYPPETAVAGSHRVRCLLYGE